MTCFPDLRTPASFTRPEHGKEPGQTNAPPTGLTRTFVLFPDGMEGETADFRVVRMYEWLSYFIPFERARDAKFAEFVEFRMWCRGSGHRDRYGQRGRPRL